MTEDEARSRVKEIPDSTGGRDCHDWSSTAEKGVPGRAVRPDEKTEGGLMSENPNPITIENSVLILIDHQPWVAFSVQSIDTTLLVSNVTGLATVARD